jgi:methionyl-tRNA formyltransferase
MPAPIRTIFIGTPAFSVPALEALLADRQFEVVAAVSQPDRPIGRRQLITPTPVKEAALKHGLTVLQPGKISDILPRLTELKPDVIVVVAYAQIIPEAVLNLPRYGCINIHASLLPKYRGAAVLQAPILSGDKETGVTIMKMDKSLDTGPIIFQAKVELDPEETPLTLAQKLAPLGAAILPDVLKRYVSGELKPQPQNNALASYVKTLTREDGRIDWSHSAVRIERQVRAMTPWPGTWTTWQGQILKITKVEHEPHHIEHYRHGEVFIDHGHLAVQCGIDSLIIERLQLEGKSGVSEAEFLRGYPEIVHTVLT